MPNFEQFPKQEKGEIDIDVKEFDEGKIEDSFQNLFEKQYKKIITEKSREELVDTYEYVNALVERGDVHETNNFLEYVSKNLQYFIYKERVDFENLAEKSREMLESERDANLPPLEQKEEIASLREVRKILFNLEKSGKLTKKEAKARFLEEYEVYRKEREWQKEGIEYLRGRIIGDIFKNLKTASGLNLYDLRMRIENPDDFKRFEKEKSAPMDILLEITEDNTSAEDIFELIDKKAPYYRLTEDQKQELYKTVDGLMEKRKKVQRWRDRDSDEEIIKKVLGKEPEGQIDVITTPFAFLLRCKNIKDFAVLSSGKKEITPSEMEFAKKAGAFFLPDKGGIFMVERAVEKNEFDWEKFNTLIHEEQHNIDYTVGDATFINLPEKLEDARKKEFETLFEEDKTRKELAEKEYTKGLREYRKYYEFRAASEVLAYIKQGEGINSSFKKITQLHEDGGIYDYFSAEVKNYIAEEIKEKSEVLSEDSIKEMINQIFVNEYQNLLKNAKEAIELMENNYVSREKMVNFLQNRPIREWTKEVRRKLRKKREEGIDVDVSEFE